MPCVFASYYPLTWSIGGTLSLLFLFSHGFIRQDFTKWREIWHEATPISQTGLLKFFGSQAQHLGPHIQNVAFCSVN